MDARVGPRFSRREILAMAGALVVVGVAPAYASQPNPTQPNAAQPNPNQPDPTDAPPDAALFALARFTPHVGSAFEIRTVRGPAVRATLTEATASAPHPADRPGLSGESFSLIFAGNRDKALDDGTYSLVHPALGTFPLFLVGVDQGRVAQQYQAVVDRRAERS